MPSIVTGTQIWQKLCRKKCRPTAHKYALFTSSCEAKNTNLSTGLSETLWHVTTFLLKSSAEADNFRIIPPRKKTAMPRVTILSPVC